jgi:H+/Cl- antiporter ClcA
MVNWKLYGVDPKKRLDQFVYLIKWVICACAVGLVVGLIITGFYYALHFATSFRMEHPRIIWLLPAAGLLIVFLYHAWKDYEDAGTNLVLRSISGNQRIPLKKAPLIFAGTFLTHLFGGSSGRESAALQIGGCVGQNVGHLLKLEEVDKKTITMCGMSAAFAALFGTPMSAAFLAMEIASVGVLYYSALVPCVLSALTAASLARVLGAEADVFRVTVTPDFTIRNALIAAGLAICCAVLSTIFCRALRAGHWVFKQHLKNQYLRIAVGGGMVAVLSFLCGPNLYNGAGMDVIERAVEGDVVPWAFLLKILFTVLTLEAGYKGGEIVPSLYIGATFGAAAANLFGLHSALCGAIGMGAMFCGVTNCPVAALLLCFEMFGYRGMPFYLLAIALAYTFSGYSGLYGSQTFVYSKLHPNVINRKVG